LHGSTLPAPPGAPLDVDPSSVIGRPSRVLTCEPGDAIVLHSLVPHRSAANASAGPRRCWFTSWVAGRWGNRYEAVYGGRLGGYRPPVNHPAFDLSVD
jgi:hypothetical protein